jgi:hypothetical protein
MTQTSSASTQETITLSPNYALPVVLLLAGLLLALWQIWLGGIIAAFALFLMIQTATIRLTFTETALDVYRSGKLIRQFPYADWLNWQIFWQPVPILFYFREVKSIHFLPILFDAKTLKQCLEERCSVQ